MKRLIATAFCTLIFLISNVPAQSSPGNSPQLRQKTFEKIWQVVDEKFFDPNFNGVDWKAVRTQYAVSVSKTKSDEEFYALMQEMLKLPKMSHMGVIPPAAIEKQKRPPVVVGLGYREFDGHVVVTRVMEGTSASEMNLKPGFVIEKIDGEAIKTFADAAAKLAGDVNTKVRVSYTDETDTAKEVTLERRPLAIKDKTNIGGMNFFGLFEAKRLHGNIGYIRFSNFLDALDPQIKSAFESMRDATGMIIDLRGNSGGEDSVGIKLASYFFDRETQLMISKQRKGDNFDYKTKGTKDSYRGPLVILVDELSMSASEEFSAGMQAAGRAVIVGKRTLGQDLEGDLASLPDGSILLYAMGQTRTPKGYIVEGNGVRPNIEVALSRKDLLSGIDTQLATAIDYIASRGFADRP